ncbi:hypothetical protein CDV36_002689 [Fusarium kuroshium]|uniref:Hsp70 family chaperone n=1 Tax=Fusarium kuroshium TaxID=2010991 RepID=A0A3M2SK29_9HYPO|nr:hypothetical protein CDV36_002689 [Fusarium kuroshium]
MPSSEATRDPPTEVPDLVVGIDFGMTGTAVAFAFPVDQKISVLRDWPGSHLAQDKVPSIIAYQANNPSSWGFDVNTQEMPKAPGIKSFFKGVFDEKDLLQANQETGLNITIDEVERWLTDYLRQLYGHIKNSLEGRLPKWEAARIRFLFSYPTTWSEETVQRFKKVIQKAGFGRSDGPSSGPHEIEVTLNEAEAAMAYSFAESKLPNAGDHLMIADIGGGTSDVSIFQVKGYEDMSPKLFLQAAGQGMNTGSTKIDEGFETTLRKQLRSLPQLNLGGADSAMIETAIELRTWKMVQDPAFLNAKCKYGNKPSGPLIKPFFYVPVPQLDTSFSDQRLEVENGRMRFYRDKLFKPLFDDQCRKIWDLFESQIEKCFSPSESSLDKIKLHVILAGGMGSSKYVQDFLGERFRERYATVPQFAVAGEPQLAVCKGLVHDALKEINQGGIFRYSAQAWYGIAKNNSFQSVEWFLRKDEELSLSASRDVKRLLDMDDKGKMGLQVVKTTEDVQVGWISNKSKQLGRDPTVVESLTDKLPLNKLKGLRFLKSKCQVTIRVRLGRGAMRFEMTQGKETVGNPLYVSELWHLTPTLCEGKARGSPRTPGGARINKEKNINWGTLGTWLFGGTALAAAIGFGVTQVMKDKAEEKEEEEKKEVEKKRHEQMLDAVSGLKT